MSAARTKMQTAKHRMSHAAILRKQQEYVTSIWFAKPANVDFIRPVYR